MENETETLKQDVADETLWSLLCFFSLIIVRISTIISVKLIE